MHTSLLRSDDEFLARLATVEADVTARLRDLSDVAGIAIERDRDTWAVRAEPHAPGACPLDLVVRIGAQRIDLGIGPETYEDEPAAEIAHIALIMAAITDGRVLTRTWRSAMTNRSCRIDTIVRFPGASEWRRTRALLPAAPLPGSAGLIAVDRHYLPYRR